MKRRWPTTQRQVEQEYGLTKAGAKLARRIAEALQPILYTYRARYGPWAVTDFLDRIASLPGFWGLTQKQFEDWVTWEKERRKPRRRK